MRAALVGAHWGQKKGPGSPYCGARVLRNALTPKRIQNRVTVRRGVPIPPSQSPCLLTSRCTSHHTANNSSSSNQPPLSNSSHTTSMAETDQQPPEMEQEEEPSAAEKAQMELRKRIMKIMMDTTLTDAEKAQRRQDLMSGKWSDDQEPGAAGEQLEACRASQAVCWALQVLGVWMQHSQPALEGSRQWPRHVLQLLLLSNAPVPAVRRVFAYVCACLLALPLLGLNINHHHHEQVTRTATRRRRAAQQQRQEAARRRAMAARSRTCWRTHSSVSSASTCARGQSR